MLIAANTFFCAGIIILSLMRVFNMTKGTRWTIVYSNAFMAGGGLAGLLGPFAWGMEAHAAVVFMEATHVAFLLACQRIWNYPLPLAFLRRIPHIAEQHKS